MNTGGKEYLQDRIITGELEKCPKNRLENGEI